MGGDAIISSLVNLGTGGAVIIALVYFWRMKDQGDKFLLDRIDKIVDRHLAEERSAREQNKVLFDEVRTLFDRVIGICNELSKAVRDLAAATHANERAIVELKEQFKSMGRP